MNERDALRIREYVDALLQVKTTRGGFLGGVAALGLAACSPTKQPDKLKKVVPQILTPLYEEDSTLTDEEHALARRVSQDIIDTASELLTNGYLERGFRFNATTEREWVRRIQSNRAGIWVAENIFTGSDVDNTSQSFAIFNDYELDYKTINRRSIWTGDIPAFLNTGSIPGRPFGMDTTFNIPQDALRSVAEAVIDLPNGLNWRDYVDLFDNGQLFPALIATGEVDRRFYDLKINTYPSAFLTITEPTG